MGKVIETIQKIRKMSNRKLFERFKFVNQAQAIREYLGSKEDIHLALEVRLTGEEIIERMRVQRRKTKNEDKK